MYCFHKLNKAEKDQKVDFLARVEGKGKIDNLPFMSESCLSAFSREFSDSVFSTIFHSCLSFIHVIHTLVFLKIQEHNLCLPFFELTLILTFF